tara:strand:+ start:613 stop:1167 length:555 start_codon:yes stop_codon:yes gene_type:complete
MLLLSIDVGIRNLAYIIIRIDNLKHDIIEWKVIELCDKSVNASKVNNIDLGIVMNEKLNTICDKYEFDKILIENQIGKNAIKMKCIQNMLVMYYIIKGYKSYEIINYNASNKLRIFIKEKTTYAQRKKISKDITLKLCEKYYGNFLEYYKKSKKKDDLSDCLLQLLDYMKKEKYVDEKYLKSIL